MPASGISLPRERPSRLGIVRWRRLCRGGRQALVAVCRIIRTYRALDVELADTFDQLLGRLDAAFESQRRFVANASHELRTPLTLQRSLVEVALADPGADQDGLRATCGKVLDASLEQERLIEALLVLARSQRGLDQRQGFDLATVTESVLRERQDTITGQGLRVASALAPAVASGDPSLVGRLVANLVDNAVRHNVPDGWIDVSTAGTADGAILRIGNSGPVIPAEQVDELFEPFERLGADRTHRDGLGLGLSIVAAVVTAHTGTLGAHALPEGGLDIEIELPAPAALG